MGLPAMERARTVTVPAPSSARWSSLQARGRLLRFTLCPLEQHMGRGTVAELRHLHGKPLPHIGRAGDRQDDGSVLDRCPLAVEAGSGLVVGDLLLRIDGGPRVIGFGDGLRFHDGSLRCHPWAT